MGGWQALQVDGLFCDGLEDVLCCGGDSLEEDLRWGPRLGALVDLVEFEDGVTNSGVALFKIVEALSGGAFFFSTSQGRISPYKFLVPCLSVMVKFTNQ